MAAQVCDTKTPQIPGLPPAPKKRGRKPVGDAPMTAAERMAKSRQRRRTECLTTTQGLPRLLVPFSCTVDDKTRTKLNAMATGQGITLGELLDQICDKL